MTTYGVVPEGFRRKPLSVILAEIEEANVETFGPDVIQTAASPLGQLNGLMANLVNRTWEMGEGVYHANDPDQAEGVNLIRLGVFRLISPTPGESTESLRRAITNADRADIDLEDINRAVQSVDGVTWAFAYINTSKETDANGVPPNSVAVAALGGDDADVAAAVRRHVAPGVGSYGNTKVEPTVGGHCRTVRILRPSLIELSLIVTVQTNDYAYACQTPAAEAIKGALFAGLTGDTRLINGEPITLHRLRSAIASMPNVEIYSAEVIGPSGLPSSPPYVIGFDEIADIALDRITVRYAS